MKRSVSNRTFIIYFSAIAVISLIYGITNYRAAFPEVALNIQVSRTEAIEQAQNYLTERNFDVSEYTQTAIFTGQGLAKHFIDMELGVERLTELALDSLDLWYWKVRFFEPLQSLEYWVRIDPAGEVIAFNRTVAEEDSGSTLSPEVAKIMVEAFLINQLNIDLEYWEYIEVNSEDRPYRRDHTFTYELINFRVADAPYRIDLRMQGAVISGYSKSLKVPESWMRKFRNLRSDNDMYQNIANALSFLILVMMFFYFFRHIRQRQVPWKTAFLLGGILAVAKFAMTLNSMPITMSGFDTTKSMSAFLSESIIIDLIISLKAALVIILMIGAGEMLYRRDYPTKLALHNLLTKRGYRSSEFIQATFVGYLMVAVVFGFMVFYYIIGKKFGIWAPANIDFSNTVSTWMPWIYPLAISLGAALAEEFMFRMFGISLFLRLTRSKFLAVIIPAFIWGFMHSFYAQEPGFARGIEVGIIGIIAGVVMLRFGIWATLVWHFVMDVVLIDIALFQSDSIFLWISGLAVSVVLAIPAIIALIIYLRTKKFGLVEDLLNRNVINPPQLKPRVKNKIIPKELNLPNAQDNQMSPSSRKIAFIVGLAGIIIALFPTKPELSDSYNPIVSRSEAIETAKSGLQDKYGIDPEEYLISIIDTEWLLSDYDNYRISKSAMNSYLHKYGDIEVAKNILFEEGKYSYSLWMIHLQKEFETEGYRCAIDKHRGTPSFWQDYSDTTSGAELSLDSARTLAYEVFKQKEIYFDQFVMMAENTRQRPARKDHFFNWRDTTYVVGEAFYTHSGNVHGDEVHVSVGRSLTIPEGWLRWEKEKSSRYLIVQILSFGLIIMLTIHALWSLGHNVIKQKISWKAGWIAGGLSALVLTMSKLNELPSLYFNYNSSVPLSKFLLNASLTDIFEVLAPSLFIVVGISLAEALIRSNYGQSPWTSSNQSKQDRLNELSIFIGSVGLVVGVGWVLSAATEWFNLPVHNFELKSIGTLSMYSIAFGNFAEAFQSISQSTIVIIFVMLIRSSFAKYWVRWLAVLLIAGSIVAYIGVSSGNLTSPEFIWIIARGLVLISVTYFIITNWIRHRILLFIVIVFTISLTRSGFIMVSWTIQHYHMQAIITLILSSIPILWISLKILFTHIKSRQTMR